MANRDNAKRDIALAERKLSLSEAVDVAKRWLVEMLEKEDVKNIGLEEINHRGKYWYVTLGFSRPWDTSRNAVTVLTGEISIKRTYKSLVVDENTGEVVSMASVNKD